MKYVQLGWVITILCVVIFLIFIIFNCEKVYTENIQHEEDNTKFNIVPNALITKRKNCDSNEVYCMSDSDCTNSCTTKNPSLFRCNYGKCDNVTITNLEPTTNPCSAKDGYLAYMVGDVQFGRYVLLCKSIDPGIATVTIHNENEYTFENKICVDGKMSKDIDYIDNFPEYINCVCKNEDIPILTPNTKTIRPHVVCKSSAYEALFNDNNMIYYKDQNKN